MLTNLQQTINARRRIYLVRHGDVSYFDGDGQPFHQDDVPLNEVGRSQARELAAELQPVAIDHVIVSGLRRSVQTAETLVAGRDLTPEVRKELREIAPGPLANIPPERLEDTFTGALRGSIVRETSFLGGETFGSLQQRVLLCLESLLADKEWKSLLIVAHGGTNRVIISHALSAGLQAMATLEQEPACLNIIDVDPDGSFIVRLVNYSPAAPVKDGIRMTTMEKIFSDYMR